MTNATSDAKIKQQPSRRWGWKALIVMASWHSPQGPEFGLRVSNTGFGARVARTDWSSTVMEALIVIALALALGAGIWP